MDLLYRSVVESDLQNYMGQTFEIMCRSWLINHMDSLPFIISDIGEWWGSHSKLKKEVQLDIVAVSPKPHQGGSGKQYLIGSCKYRNEKIGIDELNLIREYASVFTSANDQCFYYIFSKGGFTESLQAAAREGYATLVSLEAMYR